MTTERTQTALQKWSRLIAMKAKSEFPTTPTAQRPLCLHGLLTRKLGEQGLSITLTPEDISAWLAAKALPQDAKVRQALYDVLNIRNGHPAMLEGLCAEVPEAKQVAYAVVRATAGATTYVFAKPTPVAEDTELAAYKQSVANWRSKKPAGPVLFARRALTPYGPEQAAAELAALDAGSPSLEVTNAASSTTLTQESYLKAARVGFGLSREEVAAAIGKSVQMVRLVEYGSENPLSATGKAMASHYAEKQRAITAREIADQVPAHQRKVIFNKAAFQEMETHFHQRHRVKKTTQAERVIATTEPTSAAGAAR